jgi:hypothetical protein
MQILAVRAHKRGGKKIKNFFKTKVKLYILNSFILFI